MKKIFACIALLAATTLFAQQPPPAEHKAPQGPPKSPPMTETVNLAGKAIAISYSSPRVNGREGHIFTPGGLISRDPGYPVWRAGANAATKLTSEAELTFGDVKLPKGEYTLFINIAEPEGWVLVINKQVGEWGLRRDPAQDLAQVKMTMHHNAAPVEELRYTLKDLGNGKASLAITWESKSAAVEFTAR